MTKSNCKSVHPSVWETEDEDEPIPMSADEATEEVELDGLLPTLPTDEPMRDEWTTIDYDASHYYDKTLDEMLYIGYPDSKCGRIGIRQFPTGFMNWCRSISEKRDISMSKLQRILVTHGLSIAYHDERIKVLLRLHSKKVQEAEIKGSRIAMKMLEQKKANVGFISTVDYHTSFPMLEVWEGPLSKLAAAIGISVTKLLCYLCMMSLLTLSRSEPSSSRRFMQEELGVFWSLVDARIKEWQQPLSGLERA